MVWTTRCFEYRVHHLHTPKTHGFVEGCCWTSRGIEPRTALFHDSSSPVNITNYNDRLLCFGIEAEHFSGRCPAVATIHELTTSFEAQCLYLLSQVTMFNFRVALQALGLGTQPEKLELRMVNERFQYPIGQYYLPPGINAAAYITRVMGLRSSGVRPSDIDSSIYGSQAVMMASE